jgi:hypothetical protein
MALLRSLPENATLPTCGVLMPICWRSCALMGSAHNQGIKELERRGGDYKHVNRRKVGQVVA